VNGSVERLQAVLLAHSREAEQKADALGLHYLSDAGYDPAEMPGVLHAIERAVGQGASPTWIATHPSWERRFENLAVEQSNLTNPGALVEHEKYLRHLDGLTFGPDRRGGYVKGTRFVMPSRGYQITFPSGWTLSSDGAAVRGRSPAQDAVIEVTQAVEPTADSAANVFFATLARLRDSRTRSRVNGLTVVSGGFTWLPQEKLRGSASFIETGGRVYRAMGYTGNREWPANQAGVEATLRTVEPVPDSVMRQVRPLRVATFSLARPASISALVTARPTSVQPADLALMNQVPSDSLLPAGRRVKWVVGADGQ
jgi:predicted Zn-dependent protease